MSMHSQQHAHAQIHPDKPAPVEDKPVQSDQTAVTRDEDQQRQKQPPKQFTPSEREYWQQKLPSGFQFYLERQARSIIRNQPQNILTFSASYFEELLVSRNAELWKLPTESYFMKLYKKKTNALPWKPNRRKLHRVIAESIPHSVVVFPDVVALEHYPTQMIFNDEAVNPTVESAPPEPELKPQEFGAVEPVSDPAPISLAFDSSTSSFDTAEDATLYVMDGLQAKEKSVLHSLNDSLHSDADSRRAADTDDDRHTEDSSKSSMVTNVSTFASDNTQNNNKRSEDEGMTTQVESSAPSGGCHDDEKCDVQNPGEPLPDDVTHSMFKDAAAGHGGDNNVPCRKSPVSDESFSLNPGLSTVMGNQGQTHKDILCKATLSQCQIVFQHAIDNGVKDIYVNTLNEINGTLHDTKYYQNGPTPPAMYLNSRFVEENHQNSSSEAKSEENSEALDHLSGSTSQMKQELENCSTPTDIQPIGADHSSLAALADDRCVIQQLDNNFSCVVDAQDVESNDVRIHEVNSGVQQDEDSIEEDIQARFRAEAEIYFIPIQLDEISVEYVQPNKDVDAGPVESFDKKTDSVEQLPDNCTNVALQDVDVGNQLQDVDVGNQLQDVDVGNQLQNVDVGNQLQNVDVGNQLQNVDVGNQLQDVDVGNQLQNVDVGNQLQDVDVGNQLQNVDVGNQLQNVDVGNQLQDVDVVNQLQDGCTNVDVAQNLQDGKPDVCQEYQNEAKVNLGLEEAVVTEHGENSHENASSQTDTEVVCQHLEGLGKERFATAIQIAEKYISELKNVASNIEKIIDLQNMRKLSQEESKRESKKELTMKTVVKIKPPAQETDKTKQLSAGEHHPMVSRSLLEELANKIVDLYDNTLAVGETMPGESLKKARTGGVEMVCDQGGCFEGSETKKVTEEGISLPTPGETIREVSVDCNNSHSDRKYDKGENTCWDVNTEIDSTQLQYCNRNINNNGNVFSSSDSKNSNRHVLEACATCKLNTNCNTSTHNKMGECATCKQNTNCNTSTHNKNKSRSTKAKHASAQKNTTNNSLEVESRYPSLLKPTPQLTDKLIRWLHTCPTADEFSQPSDVCDVNPPGYPLGNVPTPGYRHIRRPCIPFPQLASKNFQKLSNCSFNSTTGEAGVSGTDQQASPPGTQRKCKSVFCRDKQPSLESAKKIPKPQHRFQKNSKDEKCLTQPEKQAGQQVPGEKSKAPTCKAGVVPAVEEKKTGNQVASKDGPTQVSKQDKCTKVKARNSHEHTTANYVDCPKGISLKKKQSDHLKKTTPKNQETKQKLSENVNSCIKQAEQETKQKLSENVNSCIKQAEQETKQKPSENVSLKQADRQLAQKKKVFPLRVYTFPTLSSTAPTYVPDVARRLTIESPLENLMIHTTYERPNPLQPELRGEFELTSKKQRIYLGGKEDYIDTEGTRRLVCETECFTSKDPLTQNLVLENGTLLVDEKPNSPHHLQRRNAADGPSVSPAVMKDVLLKFNEHRDVQRLNHTIQMVGDFIMIGGNNYMHSVGQQLNGSNKSSNALACVDSSSMMDGRVVPTALSGCGDGCSLYDGDRPTLHLNTCDKRDGNINNNADEGSNPQGTQFHLVAEENPVEKKHEKVSYFNCALEATEDLIVAGAECWESFEDPSVQQGSSAGLEYNLNNNSTTKVSEIDDTTLQSSMKSVSAQTNSLAIPCCIFKNTYHLLNVKELEVLNIDMEAMQQTSGARPTNYCKLPRQEKSTTKVSEIDDTTLQSSMKSKSTQTYSLAIPCSMFKNTYHILDVKELEVLNIDMEAMQQTSGARPTNYCKLPRQEKSNPCQTQRPSRSPRSTSWKGCRPRKTVSFSVNDSLHSDADSTRAADTDDDRHTEDSTRSKLSMMTNVSIFASDNTQNNNKRSEDEGMTTQVESSAPSGGCHDDEKCDVQNPGEPLSADVTHSMFKDAAAGHGGDNNVPSMKSPVSDESFSLNPDLSTVMGNQGQTHKDILCKATLSQCQIVFQHAIDNGVKDIYVNTLNEINGTLHDTKYYQHGPTPPAMYLNSRFVEENHQNSSGEAKSEENSETLDHLSGSTSQMKQELENCSTPTDIQPIGADHSSLGALAEDKCVIQQLDNNFSCVVDAQDVESNDVRIHEVNSGVQQDEDSIEEDIQARFRAEAEIYFIPIQLDEISVEYAQPSKDVDAGPVESFDKKTDSVEQLPDNCTNVVLQDVDVGNQLQDVDVGNQLQDVDVGNQLQDVDVGNQLQDVDVGNQLQDVDVGNQLQDVDVGNQLQDVDVGNQLQDVDVGNQLQDVDVGNQLQDVDVGNQLQDVDVGNQLQDGCTNVDVAQNLQGGKPDVCQECQNEAKVNLGLEEAVVTEQGENSHENASSQTDTEVVCQHLEGLGKERFATAIQIAEKYISELKNVASNIEKIIDHQNMRKLSLEESKRESKKELTMKTVVKIKPPAQETDKTKQLSAGEHHPMVSRSLLEELANKIVDLYDNTLAVGETMPGESLKKARTGGVEMVCGQGGCFEGSETKKVTEEGISLPTPGETIREVPVDCNNSHSDRKYDKGENTCWDVNTEIDSTQLQYCNRNINNNGNVFSSSDSKNSNRHVLEACATCKLNTNCNTSTHNKMGECATCKQNTNCNTSTHNKNKSRSTKAKHASAQKNTTNNSLEVESRYPSLLKPTPQLTDKLIRWLHTCPTADEFSQPSDVCDVNPPGYPLGNVPTPGYRHTRRPCIPFPQLASKNFQKLSNCSFNSTTGEAGVSGTDQQASPPGTQRKCKSVFCRDKQPSLESAKKIPKPQHRFQKNSKDEKCLTQPEKQAGQQVPGEKSKAPTCKAGVVPAVEEKKTGNQVASKDGPTQVSKQDKCTKVKARNSHEHTTANYVDCPKGISLKKKQSDHLKKTTPKNQETKQKLSENVNSCIKQAEQETKQKLSENVNSCIKQAEQETKQKPSENVSLKQADRQLAQKKKVFPLRVYTFPTLSSTAPTYVPDVARRLTIESPLENLMIHTTYERPNPLQPELRGEFELTSKKQRIYLGGKEDYIDTEGTRRLVCETECFTSKDPLTQNLVLENGTLLVDEKPNSPHHLQRRNAADGPSVSPAVMKDVLLKFNEHRDVQRLNHTIQMVGDFIMIGGNNYMHSVGQQLNGSNKSSNALACVDSSSMMDGRVVPTALSGCGDGCSLYDGDRLTLHLNTCDKRDGNINNNADEGSNPQGTQFHLVAEENPVEKKHEKVSYFNCALEATEDLIVAGTECWESFEDPSVQQGSSAGLEYNLNNNSTTKVSEIDDTTLKDVDQLPTEATQDEPKRLSMTKGRRRSKPSGNKTTKGECIDCIPSLVGDADVKVYSTVENQVVATDISICDAAQTGSSLSLRTAELPPRDMDRVNIRGHKLWTPSSCCPPEPNVRGVCVDSEVQGSVQDICPSVGCQTGKQTKEFIKGYIVNYDQVKTCECYRRTNSCSRKFDFEVQVHCGDICRTNLSQTGKSMENLEPFVRRQKPREPGDFPFEMVDFEAQVTPCDINPCDEAQTGASLMLTEPFPPVKPSLSDDSECNDMTWGELSIYDMTPEHRSISAYIKTAEELFQREKTDRTLYPSSAKTAKAPSKVRMAEANPSSNDMYRSSRQPSRYDNTMDQDDYRNYVSTDYMPPEQTMDHEQGEFRSVPRRYESLTVTTYQQEEAHGAPVAPKKRYNTFGAGKALKDIDDQEESGEEEEGEVGNKEHRPYKRKRKPNDGPSVGIQTAHDERKKSILY
ncbi:uncharacterized protein LOC131939788 [Physella acuta]|uniref:uncharacterized protein LOC131939788 n=1 Tax=Physella acuta TaxID=109671 RepID=UPI0027DC6C33|nr:uncharacterized protein LOC131939788 [Physella acuta]